MKYLKKYNENNYNNLIIACEQMYEKKALQDWMFNNGYRWNNTIINQKLNKDSFFWDNKKKFVQLNKDKNVDCLFFQIGDDEFDEYNQYSIDLKSVNKESIIDVNELPGIEPIINGYKMNLI